MWIKFFINNKINIDRICSAHLWCISLDSHIKDHKSHNNFKTLQFLFRLIIRDSIRIHNLSICRLVIRDNIRILHNLFKCSHNLLIYYNSLSINKCNRAFSSLCNISSRVFRSLCNTISSRVFSNRFIIHLKIISSKVFSNKAGYSNLLIQWFLKTNIIRGLIREKCIDNYKFILEI